MATPARRASLNIDGGQNAGLLLNRYLSQHDDTHEGAKKLYQSAEEGVFMRRRSSEARLGHRSR
ncbi:MAG: hypothetical protein C4335_08035 [Armatimonadota bacterium]